MQIIKILMYISQFLLKVKRVFILPMILATGHRAAYIICGINIFQGGITLTSFTTTFVLRGKNYPRIFERSSAWPCVTLGVEQNGIILVS